MRHPEVGHSLGHNTKCYTKTYRPDPELDTASTKSVIPAPIHLASSQYLESDSAGGSSIAWHQNQLVSIPGKEESKVRISLENASWV